MTAPTKEDLHVLKLTREQHAFILYMFHQHVERNTTEINQFKAALASSILCKFLVKSSDIMQVIKDMQKLFDSETYNFIEALANEELSG